MSEIGKIIPLRGQAPEPLWREVLGNRLRSLRTDRDETLARTAERAGISPQYLSEIERGRKEASSEMIAALAGALGIAVADLMAVTADDLRRIADTAFADSAFAVTRVTTRTELAGRTARSRRRPAGPVALAMAA